jgi:hypothetical protein
MKRKICAFIHISTVSAVEAFILDIKVNQKVLHVPVEGKGEGGVPCKNRSISLYVDPPYIGLSLVTILTPGVEAKTS